MLESGWLCGFCRLEAKPEAFLGRAGATVAEENTWCRRLVVRVGAFCEGVLKCLAMQNLGLVCGKRNRGLKLNVSETTNLLPELNARVVSTLSTYVSFARKRNS